MTAATISTPRARPATCLIDPPPSIAGCVRAFITRDTTGANLAASDRVNHLPATPGCALTWFIRGDVAAVTDESGALGPWQSGALFAGPRTVPSITYNPGPVKMFVCVLLPDALHALTGIRCADWLDRVVPAGMVFDSTWQAMAAEVFVAATDAQRVRILEGFLMPRWQAAGAPGSADGPPTYAGWALHLASRASTHAAGRGVRQIERRIKDRAGLPMKALRGLARAEQLFLQSRASDAQDDLAWPMAAADAGYSDQSQMCRDVRRVTGLSPGELRRRVAQEESFWAYRVWR